MSEPIRIHHISDLHFGIFQKAAGEVKAPYKGAVEPTPPYEAYLRHLEGLKSANRLPDFIVISGDLTSIAAESEFEEAGTFVRHVHELVTPQGESPERRRVIIVPGNHDFNYAQIDTAASEGTDPAKARRDNLFQQQLVFWDRLKTYMLPFDFSATSKSTARVHDVECRGVQLRFLCVDSNQLAGHVREDIITRLKDIVSRLATAQRRFLKGELNPQQLREIMRDDPGYVRVKDLPRASKDDEQGPTLRILVQHHPVVAVETADIGYTTLLNAGEWFSTLRNWKPHLMLFGHTHSHDCVYERRLGVDGVDAWGTFALIGGTLGGSGDDAGTYAELTVSPVPNESQPDGWYCRYQRFSTTAAKGGVPEPARFYVDSGHRITAHLIRLQEQRADGKQAAEQSFQKLARLLENATREATLQKKVVEDENYRQLVQSYDGLYAVDVQAFDAWLDPLVYYYFAMQVPRYLAAVFNPAARTWRLRLTKRLHTAVTRAQDYSRSVLGNSASVLGNRTQTLIELRKRIPRGTRRGATPPEMARILLWTPEELTSPEGEAVVAMHEALRIPLFFLPRQNITLDSFRGHSPNGWDATLLKKASDFEYIYFTEKNRCQGGMYVKLSAAASHRADTLFMKDAKIDGLFQPRAHFELLLQHEKLMFAVDAIEIERQRSS